MFISVMNVIHERLPCSQYIFRQKKNFKSAECQKKAQSLKCGDDQAAKAEEMCLSPLRALASPKMLSSFKPN